MTDILTKGTRAPGFTLHVTPGSTPVTPTTSRGKPVVLVFYPADWSPVCGDQLALYNELGGEFARFNAALLPISVDGVWSHAALGSQRNCQFPLWSDFEPKGASRGVRRVPRPTACPSARCSSSTPTA